MGGCFSNLSIGGGSDNDDNLSSSANVITIDGQLRQFPVPITVSLILRQIEANSKSNSSFFICNSDSLFYDELIPALDSEYQLQSGQIYFVLPNSKLQFPLSASEMAALAVKASVALSSINSNGGGGGRRSKSRISPVLVNESVETVSVYGYDMNIMKKKNTRTSTSASAGVSRSGSMRKLQRYSSRRAKVAARSFRIRLTTIYEGSDLQFY